MNSQTGLALRLLGPLIEVGCLVLLNRYGDRGLTLLGLPVEWFCYAGFVGGVVAVAAGLMLVRRPGPPVEQDHEEPR